MDLYTYIAVTSVIDIHSMNFLSIYLEKNIDSSKNYNDLLVINNWQLSLPPRKNTAQTV